MSLRAEVVSVGTELLLGQTVDTNAAYLAKSLSSLGITVYRRTTVGDNLPRLVTALKAAFAENDIVITIGGLGPTMDDLTRDGIAEALGDTLERDEEIVANLTQFFLARGVTPTENNFRQAYVPRHGRALKNPHGTAPGLYFHKDGKVAFALPGPPNEFIPMVENEVAPIIHAMTGDTATIQSRVLRIIGMGESLVEDTVKDLMLSTNPTVAPYAKVGEVHLRVTAKAATKSEADDLINARVEELKQRLGEVIYAENDETLERAVVSLLRAKMVSISTAESCTGGLLAQRITDVPGSSEIFPGGIICYSNETKIRLLGVDPNQLERTGAVSEETAVALAEGVRKSFHTTLGVGITGIAGPGGGTEAKPVGLVYIALSTPETTLCERCLFIGSRSIVRTRSSQTALNLMRLQVLRSQ